MVTKGLDGCLFVYENTEWKILEEKLKSLPLTNANARKITRFFLAGATLCVMVGVGNRIEIWSKESWTSANVYDDMDEIAESMEGLGI